MLVSSMSTRRPGRCAAFAFIARAMNTRFLQAVFQVEPVASSCLRPAFDRRGVPRYDALELF
jgi:hypothetical protein